LTVLTKLTVFKTERSARALDQSSCKFAGRSQKK
jgi:hypothetical protein